MTTRANLVERYEVLDGDTVRCWLDLNYYVGFRVDVRLRGINCPEVEPHGGAARAAEWPAGAAVKAWVERLLAEWGPLTCLSYQLDKFAGRTDGDLRGARQDSLANALILARMAKLWDGKGEKPTWTTNELDAIILASKAAETPQRRGH
ncbi:MAG TPA: hypothetical protein VNM34_15015 [Verrucomicrobiae bacterium]|nr:hypothetical protein [Verrucomicrobiae bacterium]